MNRKVITTKNEQALSRAVSFNGKYVDSLENSARNLGYQGSTVVELIRDFNKKDRARRAAIARKFGFSLTNYNWLKNRAGILLSDFRTGHSMGCYRTVELKGKTAKGEREWMPFVTRHTLQEYAKSCTWRPTYGDISIRLTARELREIRNIEGVWTIVNADCSAKWLEASGSKSSYKVEWRAGFVSGTSHSTISLAAAEALEIRKRQTRAALSQNDLKFVGFDHISRFACRAGVEAFCRRHGLDIDYGYQLGYLKSLGDRYAQPFLDKVSTAG